MEDPQGLIPKHYSIQDAAQLLGCSKRTIERLIARQEIKRVVYITPRNPRIPATDLEEFLRIRTVAAS